MGLMGRILASDWLRQVADRNLHVAVEIACLHAFRTFLGDDDDFSNSPGGVS